MHTRLPNFPPSEEAGGRMPGPKLLLEGWVGGDRLPSLKLLLDRGLGQLRWERRW